MIQFKRSKINGIVLSIIALAVLFSACSTNTPIKDKNSEYCPDESFRISSPEEQGMDSEKLYNMLSFIRDEGKGIHSIKVIRNGYKVLDTSFFPYSDKNLHAVNSVTKSVTSALVGIALEEKKINSIEDKVLGYFPEKNVENLDENKNSMTIKNLLMMTGGFDWNERSYGEDDSWTKMINSDDPIGYILDQPVTKKPGVEFYYNTGSSHILSALLQKVTGEKESDYAEKKLFMEMGIKEKQWDQDKTGISVGGAGLYLKPEDMAKFGYLYLRNGKWKGKQLVPESWITESTSKQIDTPNGLAGKYGYGYQWWMNDFGGYSARGFGGQYIFVVPEKDLVVAITSGLGNSDFFLPEDLVGSFIISSISDKESLPANKTAYDKLLNMEKELAEAPKPSTPEKLSSFAKEISGNTYVLDDKTEVTFVFEKDSEGIVEYNWEGISSKYIVGLDGVWRINNNSIDGPIESGNSNAAKGEWIADKQFEYSIKTLNDVSDVLFSVNFNGDEITMDISDMWGFTTQKGKLK